MTHAIELTQTEWNVYSYLLSISDRGGDVPSYEEIGTACGIRSRRHVSKVICELDACDLVLRHGPRAKRALTVVRAPVALLLGIRKRAVAA